MLGGKKTGGMNVYVNEVGRELGRRGIPTDIFTRAESPDQVGQVVEYSPNARVIYLPCGDPTPLDTAQIALHLHEFRDGLERYVKVQGLKYDAIYSHYWMSGWVAIQVRKRWGVPVAQMFHTLGRMKNRIELSPNPLQEDVRVRGESQVMAHVDRIIAATPAEQYQLLLLYRADRRKIDIVPPGVDLSRFYPMDRAQACQKIGWRPDCKHLLFVGRIEPLKGVDNILEALAQLGQTQPALLQNLCLSIIGGNPQNAGEELLRLQYLTQALNLSEVVHFVGAQGQDQLPDYYRAAEALIMPSDYESFGMVALEAMASGTPVIASEVGGLAFLIEDGITGYHVPVRDPLALAERIQSLLASPAQRDAMGHAAAQAAQNYSWAHIVDRLLAVFTMLGTRPKRYSI
jgi:D-inositol-3-phosphate glycosyltransferase